MRADFQTDRVFLLRQVTEKKEKAKPLHFLKILFTSRTSGTFGFAPTHKVNASAKPKEPLFSIALLDFVSKRQFTFKDKV
jgi:hypothetical protein